MKYPKIRTGLLTFILGVISVPVFTPVLDKWNEPDIELPQIESTSPLVVKRCFDEETATFYRKHGYIVVNKTTGINCIDDGGGGSGGNLIMVGSYIDDAPAKANLKNLNRNTKKH